MLIGCNVTFSPLVIGAIGATFSNLPTFIRPLSLFQSPCHRGNRCNCGWSRSRRTC
jgi:hypothetical protein